MLCVCVFKIVTILKKKEYQTGHKLVTAESLKLVTQMCIVSACKTKIMKLACIVKVPELTMNKLNMKISNFIMSNF